MAENRNDETYSMQSLQQDAIRRAREMQARARFPSNYMPVSAVRHDEPHPHTEEMPVHTRAPEPPRQSGADSPARPEPPEPAPPPEEEDPMPEKFAGGMLDFLLKDSEKTLILVLMLILLEEKTDSSLIFALMYLVI